MDFTYRPKGTCAQLMELNIENDIIKDYTITGGCHGNGQGISALVKGMNIDDVIARLEGIKCGWKNTSCPDQLAQALKLYKQQKAQE